MRIRINNKFNNNKILEKYTKHNIQCSIDEAIQIINRSNFFKQQKYSFNEKNDERGRKEKSETRKEKEKIEKRKRKEHVKTKFKIFGDKLLNEKLCAIIRKERKIVRTTLRKWKKGDTSKRDKFDQEIRKEQKKFNELKENKKHKKKKEERKWKLKERNEQKKLTEKNEQKKLTEKRELKKEKKEKGLMGLYRTCTKLLKEKAYIILNKINGIKTCYSNDIKELLTELTYLLMIEDDLENSLVNMLGEIHIEFIIQIIQYKEDVKKDLKLLSKNVDIKEKTLASNFFITKKKKGKINAKTDVLYKKDNIEKIIEFFLYSLNDLVKKNVKKIFLPDENNKLTEIQVPINTIYSHTENATKVKIERLDNFQFDPKELVPVNTLPFWHKYVFSFDTFNYIQSKVFKGAYMTNKNMLVCAPTGCGKTNIAMLVILQQIVWFCKQKGLDLDHIVATQLAKRGINVDTQNISKERPLKKQDKDNWQKDEGDEEEDDDEQEEQLQKDYDEEGEYSDRSKRYDQYENELLHIDSKQFKIIYIAPMKSLVFEITNLFKKQLEIFNLTVCEYTKEYSLSTAELEKVHIIITVPEKLDILLRNSNYSTTISDESLIKYIKCLIIDEVHLLNTSRGDIIETLVVRMLRYSETSQSMRRILAMSATLPNYKDVSDFLKVDNEMCFYFSDRHRIIQLDKTLYGIHETNMNKYNIQKNIYAYNEVINSLKKNKQCIIFVSSRNDTNKTIEFLIDRATKNQELELLTHDLYTDSVLSKKARRSDNAFVKNFYEYGCSIHHAGMSRSDKILVETMFKQKAINVLCCTSTLAWGVNLPVYTVIIKGTNYFSSENGKVEDIDILDINQIFGRCGRPQYESHGNAILITERKKLYTYIKLLTNNTVIESNFLKNIENHLNAEISIGTVKNISDAIKWLEYTYLFVRMKKNPMFYGADPEDIDLFYTREKIILKAAANLSENRLIRRVLSTNEFIITFYGKVAAKYYVDYTTIGNFAKSIQRNDTDDILQIVSQAKEFENIQIRNEDMPEFLNIKNCCDIKEKYDESNYMTIKILIEAYLRRMYIPNFSIVCEINYIVQNLIRVLFAFYEICLNVLKNVSNLILNTHNLTLAIMRRLPMNCNVFWHFCYSNEILEKKNKVKQVHYDRKQKSKEADASIKSINKQIKVKYIDYDDMENMKKKRKNQKYTNYLREGVVKLLEKYNLSFESVESLTKIELLHFLRNEAYTEQLMYYKNIIPMLHIDGYIQPITNTIMRINLNVQLTNTLWVDQWNDTKEDFHVLLLNTANNDILYFENFSIQRRDRKKIHELSFEVLLTCDIPSQITVHFLSMSWCNLSFLHIFNMNHIYINKRVNIFSTILPVVPLSTKILRLNNYINFFSFKYFNPIQSQMFHPTFHTDENILLGAPTGSGKTVIAELCIMRNLLKKTTDRSIYVCPMKAIVNERYKNWKDKFQRLFKKNVIGLTGDKNEIKENIESSHIVICTPEKLDVITRNWKWKTFAKQINLVIFDEIHLLGQENRGGVIEVLVNRFKNMELCLNKKIRLVGLTTVITSVDDLILWLGVKENYLFNFPSACRLVPCESHILGFTQKAYCNRMSVMNKNVFDAINQYARSKNVLIFVSSRRQTRLTGYDIISLNMSSYNINFLHTENLLSDTKKLEFFMNTKVGTHKGKNKQKGNETAKEDMLHILKNIAYADNVYKGIEQTNDADAEENQSEGNEKKKKKKKKKNL